MGAIGIGHELLKRHPDSAYALMIFASLYPSKQIWGDKTEEIQSQWKKEIETIQKDLPQSGNGEFLLALTAMMDGKKEEAKRWIEVALTRNPDNAMSLQWKASLILSENDIQGAERLIKRAIALAPNLPQNHAILSNVYLSRGMIEEGYQEAQRESLSFFGNPAAYLSLANAALTAGDLKTAQIAVDLYLRAIPTDPGGYMTKSNILASQGRIPQAVLSAKKAFELSTLPTDQAVTHALLASQLPLMGNLDEASEHMKEALHLDPNNPYIELTQVNLLLYRHEYDGAHRITKELTSKYPQASWNWSTMATLLLQLNRTPEARSAVAEALRQNPLDIQALSIELELLLIEGDTKKVQEKMEWLRRKFPSFYFIHSLDASIEFRLGNYQEALSKAEKVLKINSYDSTALLVSGLVRASQGKLSKATRIAKRLLKLYPEEAAGSLILARIYLKQGRLKKAEEEARKAVKLWPEDAGWFAEMSPRATLVQILKAQGKNEEAGQVYRAMMSNRLEEYMEVMEDIWPF